jgi:beta-N-acetylhexosaminidase
VKYARTFVNAHREAGVATALKHFPGHGSSTDDSHEGAIDLTPTWSRVELVPFVEMIESGDADMIMLGHLELDGLTGPDGLPASLSPRTIDTFLRGTLCYDGLVVSDDLHMDAVSARWTAAEAARQVVAAGGDIILLSLPANDQAGKLAAVREALVAEARRSPHFADKLRYAYARVVNHKLDIAEARAASGRTGAPVAREWARAR